MRQYSSEAATETISSLIIISELKKIWFEATFSKIPVPVHLQVIHQFLHISFSRIFNDQFQETSLVAGFNSFHFLKSTFEPN